MRGSERKFFCCCEMEIKSLCHGNVCVLASKYTSRKKDERINLRVIFLQLLPLPLALVSMMMMLVKTMVLSNKNSSCYLPFLIISKHGSLEMNEQEIKWQKGINPKKSIKLHMAIIYTIYLLTYSLTLLALMRSVLREKFMHIDEGKEAH